MRKMFTAVAAVAAAASFSSAANAVTSLSPIDTAPDGSFSLGFSGSQLAAPNFTETFTFTVASGLTGLLSSLIGTSTATATNNVDFTSVFISGGTLASPAQLTPMTGEPNETRSLGSGVTVGAGTYTYTVQGTRVGQNLGGERGTALRFGLQEMQALRLGVL